MNTFAFILALLLGPAHPSSALLQRATFFGQNVSQSSEAPVPASVQQCQGGNGGTAIQNYTVTIASSGGTAGCTSAFTPGDMIAVGYTVNDNTTISDPTTSSISATGATIVWRKAGSVTNITFSNLYNGILYACPADITSPTSSIVITVNMGVAVAFGTVIQVQEIQGIQSTTSCLDSGSVRSQTASVSSSTPFSTTTSATLGSASELMFVDGQFGGVSPTVAAGSCMSVGATIPTHGNNPQTNITGFIEYAILSATTAGTCSAIGTASPSSTYSIMAAGFMH